MLVGRATETAKAQALRHPARHGESTSRSKTTCWIASPRRRSSERSALTLRTTSAPGSLCRRVVWWLTFRSACLNLDTLLQALAIASDAQRAVLKANYGRHDPAAVAVVKALYAELGPGGPLPGPRDRDLCAHPCQDRRSHRLRRRAGRGVPFTAPQDIQAQQVVVFVDSELVATVVGVLRCRGYPPRPCFCTQAATQVIM